MNSGHPAHTSKVYLFVLILLLSINSNAATKAEIARWEKQASNITIVRDDWGIAHVYGKTDADTVFGAEYAQAEDDFNRVETNYINAMGRLAEAEGEAKVYQDLRMKLFIDPADLKKDYEASPAWLKKLMDAYADGLNFYLYKHPDVKPRVIQHFEPWMALSFTEGSIGGDIDRMILTLHWSLFQSAPIQIENLVDRTEWPLRLPTPQRIMHCC
jgi:acyl-homoserine lactone acylase PvdQ